MCCFYGSNVVLVKPLVVGSSEEKHDTPSSICCVNLDCPLRKVDDALFFFKRSNASTPQA